MEALCLLLFLVAFLLGFFNVHVGYRKVGGLHHWRIGRVGGSFYLASRNPRRRSAI